MIKYRLVQLRERLKVLISRRTSEDYQFAQRNCPSSLFWRQSYRLAGHNDKVGGTMLG